MAGYATPALVNRHEAPGCLLASQPSSNSEFLAQWETVSRPKEEGDRGRQQRHALASRCACLKMSTHSHINTCQVLKKTFIKYWEIPTKWPYYSQFILWCVKMIGPLSREDKSQLKPKQTNQQTPNKQNNQTSKPKSASRDAGCQVVQCGSFSDNSKYGRHADLRMARLTHREETDQWEG